MSVVAADIKQYKPATPATSFSTSNIGGAINTSAQVQGTVISEVLFTMTSLTAGGGDRTQYGASHVKNTNGSDALTSAKAWLANALDDVASSGTAAVQSSSTSDDSTKKVRLLGRDGSGVAVQEEITCNGTTSAGGVQTFGACKPRAELRLVSSSALTDAEGDITVSVDGVDLGVIPTGYWSATAEVQFGFEGTLSTSTTTTKASTAPSGITFAKPRTSGSATSFANSGTLSAGTHQQVWWKWTLPELAKPSADVQVVLRWEGDTV